MRPETAPRAFFSNSAWAVAGNAIYAVCQWAMVAVLAKAGNPAVVGQFAMGLAVTAPVFLFANLQIRAIQTTDVTEEYSFGEYLGLRLLTTGTALLGLTVFLFLAGYQPPLRNVILAVAFAKAFEAVSDVFHGDLQRRERMCSVARYLILKGVLSVLAIAAVIRFTGSAKFAALAMAAVFGGVLLIGELRFAVKSPRAIWNRTAFSSLCLMALPLGFVMMMISVIANMPRYFVQKELGSGALGVFAALTYLGIAATTMINAVGLAATPRLARLFASRDTHAFSRLLLRFCLLATLPGIAGMTLLAMCGAPLLQLLYGPAYAARVDVAIWVMAAASFTCAASVFGYGLSAARCFRQQVPLFIGVTAVAAVACSKLIPGYGLAGAVWGQIASAIAQLLGSASILYVAARRTATGRTETDFVSDDVPGSVRELAV
jgi:O-antigen/teichoic acid export membrane protein